MKKAIAVLAVLAAACGCSHMDKVVASNESRYKAFAVQQRGMEVVGMEFANGVGQAGGAVTITGLTRLTLSMPLTPLADPKPERGLMGEAKDAVTGVAPFAMGAYLGGKALDNSAGASKVNNNNGAITGNVTQ